MSREDEIRVVAEMLVDVIRRAIEDHVRGGSAGAVGSYGPGRSTRVTRQVAKLTRIHSPSNILAWLREQTSYMSVAQVGRLLKKHAETVYGLISEDGLPAVKDRRRWKVDPNRLADWLEERGFAAVDGTKPGSQRASGKGDA